MSFPSVYNKDYVANEVTPQNKGEGSGHETITDAATALTAIETIRTFEVMEASDK